MTFRFAAKYGLLTYSQAPNLDPFDIVNLLAELGAECIVGRENHQDGGTHYHAFFMFPREFRTRNPRVFDCGGYHPNILRGRKTPRAMYEYATKDGDICGGGLEAPEDEPRTSSSDDFWAAVFAAEGREETFRVAREINVGLFGRYYFQVRAIGEGKAIKNPLDYVSPAALEFSTSSYPELDDWCETYLGRRGGRLGTHFYFGGHFDMNQLLYDNESVQFAVFDDMPSLKFFPMYKFWMGAQETFTVTDKYKGKMNFDWGRPIIWCNNKDPRSDPDADADWIDGNCIVVNVPEDMPLFTSHASRESHHNE
ncbi:replication-associated protein [Gemyduguivirus recro1]|uniref:Replication-associated protein n=1 Tax=Gemycircularvirus sp. TaxID=1983771 RepID=A0A2K9YNB1_9VIRU|nr:replication-associated protein [Gemycircularvirus sp.]AUW34335.1 replication-associated protein [Gemycircularvirus sp.]